MKRTIPLEDRVIVALDVPTTNDARRIVDNLGDLGAFYKIGLQLFPAGGIDLARELIAADKKVFLDFKFYDIGATVRNAVASITALGADFLTIHGDGDTVLGAVGGRGDTSLKLLAVTVLTSMNEASLRKLGYTGTVPELVRMRAELALGAGADGLIASAQEARMLRDEFGEDFILVTPGVRSPGSSAHDQKRIATPAEAFKAGADHIVVGREITRADRMDEAAQRIFEGISGVI